MKLDKGRTAWVAQSDLSDVRIPTAPSGSRPVETARIVLESFPPPAIFLTAPRPGTVTEREQIEIIGGVKAVGKTLVTQVQVFINGEVPRSRVLLDTRLIHDSWRKGCRDERTKARGGFGGGRP